MLRAFRDKFGPGLLFASTAVGLSHLVQSTRAGANYGMTLWWLLVFVSIIKYPAFRYGSMYAAATGKTLIASYERQGKLAVVVYGFALSIDALVGVPAMALVTAGLCKHIFSLTLGDRNMIFLLLIGAAAILISGKYRVFENLAKVLVVAFSVFTIIAASLALSRLDFASTTIAAPIAYDRAGILFMIAVAGVMPSSVTSSVMQSVWMCAKAETLGRLMTPREAAFDINFAYVVTIFLALCFLLMGTMLMFNQGIAVASGATGFGAQLVAMFTEVFGTWAHIIISIAALAVILSSMFALLDGCPRTGTRIVTSLRGRTESVTPNDLNRLYILLLIIQVIGGMLMVVLFMKSFRTFIDFATSVVFVSSPLIAWLNHRAMHSPEVPPEQRPSTVLRIWSILGIVLLGLFGLAYVWFSILAPAG